MPPGPDDCAALLGPAEIAGLLNVQPSTVHHWRHLNRMPDPDCTISGNPVWQRQTILDWARETGRLDEQGRALRLLSGKTAAGLPVPD